MLFKEWSIADVVRHLKSLGFGQYSQEFQLNEIAGVHLPLLTEDHLKEMGVTSVGHRILILRRFSDIINGKEITEKVFTRPARPIEAPKSPVRKVVAVAPNKKPEARFDQSSSSDDSEPEEAFVQPKPKQEAWFPPPRRVEVPKSPTKIASVPIPPNIRKKVDTQVSLNVQKKSEAPTAALVKNSENRFDGYQAGNNTCQAGGLEKGGRRSVLNIPTESGTGRGGDDPVVQVEAADNNRVTCQHCGRQLQPDAAKRHIPVCARFNAARAARR